MFSLLNIDGDDFTNSDRAALEERFKSQFRQLLVWFDNGDTWTLAQDSRGNYSGVYYDKSADICSRPQSGLSAAQISDFVVRSLEEDHTWKYEIEWTGADALESSTIRKFVLGIVIVVIVLLFLIVYSGL